MTIKNGLGEVIEAGEAAVAVEAVEDMVAAVILNSKLKDKNRYVTLN